MKWMIFKSRGELVVKILLSKCFDKHNSLIITTKKSFHEYEVFDKSNIHSIIPAFHFFKDEDIEEIYDRLIFRFKKGKILYKLSFDDFFNIYQAIHYNDYVIHMDIDYYLYMFAVSTTEYIKSGIVTKDAFSNLLESENESCKFNIKFGEFFSFIISKSSLELPLIVIY